MDLQAGLQAVMTCGGAEVCCGQVGVSAAVYLVDTWQGQCGLFCWGRILFAPECPEHW